MRRIKLKWDEQNQERKREKKEEQEEEELKTQALRQSNTFWEGRIRGNKQWVDRFPVPQTAKYSFPRVSGACVVSLRYPLVSHMGSYRVKYSQSNIRSTTF